jgi:hypothetical protein
LSKKSQKAPPGLADYLSDEPAEQNDPPEESLLDPFVTKTLKLHSKKVNKVIKCLEGIMKPGAEEQVFDAKTATLIKRPIPASVKVNAAKVWNELVMKKIVADKKDINKGSGGSQYSLAKAIADVNRRKDAEKKKIALEAGVGKN